MDLELLLVIAAAFGLFMLRLLMIGRQYRRKAARMLYIAGALCGGIIGGFFGLDDVFGIAVTITAIAVFFGAAVIAYLLGDDEEKPAKPKDLPGGNMHRDAGSQSPKDRV